MTSEQTVAAFEDLKKLDMPLTEEQEKAYAKAKIVQQDEAKKKRDSADKAAEVKQKVGTMVGTIWKWTKRVLVGITLLAILAAGMWGWRWASGLALFEKRGQVEASGPSAEQVKQAIITEQKNLASQEAMHREVKRLDSEQKRREAEAAEIEVQAADIALEHHSNHLARIESGEETEAKQFKSSDYLEEAKQRVFSEPQQ